MGFWGGVQQLLGTGMQTYGQIETAKAQAAGGAWSNVDRTLRPDLASVLPAQISPVVIWGGAIALLLGVGIYLVARK